MRDAFTDAADAYEREVRNLAAGYVRSGTAPLDALNRARAEIQRRGLSDHAERQRQIAVLLGVA
jgi:hypothetical protein